VSDEPVDPRFFEFARSRDTGLRNALVVDNQGLAYAFSRRYRDRGVASEDLDQVALESLVRSVDRFDPTLGLRFSTFAARTIDGALKQYFRDRTWDIKVPRRTRQLVSTVRTTTEALAHRLGRSPTPAEIAAELDLDVTDVTMALDAGRSHTAVAIDRVHSSDTSFSSEDFGRVEARIATPQLLDTLAPDERRVVELRFFGAMSQTQIADEIGVSQMQVSRLLRRALANLRAAADDH
jgi:RNA polymerase sigma-B factor